MPCLLNHTRYDEYAARFRIGSVDHLQVTTRVGLADRHSAPISTGTILPRLPQYVFSLFLGNAMVVDVRLPSLRVDVEADIHLQEYIVYPFIGRICKSVTSAVLGSASAFSTA
jgi:hypothetical protein